MTDTGGRRLYVHEDAFKALITDCPDQREATLRALGLALASRVAGHHLIDAGEAVGLVPDRAFSAEVGTLAAAATAALTELFRGVALSPVDPARYGSTVPLLAPEEAVVAHCWESGYFTFATGDEAARVMFAEVGSLRQLRRALRRDPAIAADLELVSGQHSLFARSGAIGVGPGTRAAYRERSRAEGTGPPSPAQAGSALEGIFGTVDETLGTAGSRDGTSAALADGAVQAIRTAVTALVHRLCALPDPHGAP
ncbi:MAG TPA: hypothetical protein VEW93_04465 [Acidimicrobiales bacterium]|nr:hypothetical protein [Acidimicrobiales bacterium]